MVLYVKESLSQEVFIGFHIIVGLSAAKVFGELLVT